MQMGGFLTDKKNRGGRPRKLKCDARTLATIRGLGRIQATTRECAAVLNVSHPTFLDFAKRHTEVYEILEEGKSLGLRSLRRQQFRAAEAGNPTMLVWLGKQYLDQKDKAEVASTVNVTVTDARSALESLVDRHAATEREEESPIRTH